MLLTIYYTKSAVSILASVNFAFTVNCILKSGVEPSLLVSFLSRPSISVTLLLKTKFKTQLKISQYTKLIHLFYNQL
jgi:hypothetical protein